MFFYVLLQLEIYLLLLESPIINLLSKKNANESFLWISV